MTLILAFCATDGLFVIVDGYRTIGSPSGERIMLSDSARKSTVAPDCNAVVLAAGATRFGDAYAADIFDVALADPSAHLYKPPTGECCDVEPVETVLGVSQTCFVGTQDAAKVHPAADRAVWTLTAGFNADEVIPRAFLSVIGQDGAQHPQEVWDFYERGVLAVPMNLPSDVANLVLSEFGYTSQTRFEELISLPPNHPDARRLDGDGYALIGLDLDTVSARVEKVLLGVVGANANAFGENGVGGTWTTYKLRPGERPVPGKFNQSRY